MLLQDSLLFISNLRFLIIFESIQKVAFVSLRVIFQVTFLTCRFCFSIPKKFYYNYSILNKECSFKYFLSLHRIYFYLIWHFWTHPTQILIAFYIFGNLIIRYITFKFRFNDVRYNTDGLA